MASISFSKSFRDGAKRRTRNLELQYAVRCSEFRVRSLHSRPEMTKDAE